MTSTEFIDSIRRNINDDTTHDVDFYGLNIDPRITTGTSQISVLAENGDAVSATASVNFLLVLYGSIFVFWLHGLEFCSHILVMGYAILTNSSVLNSYM